MTETLQTAPAILFDAARQDPDRVRFVVGERRVTLSELARAVSGCAEELRAVDVRPGDHVAIFAPNSLEWIVYALGIQAAGAAFVGVHAGSSAELARHVVEHSDAKLVIAAPSELERAGLRVLPAPILPLEPWEDLAAGPGADRFADQSRIDGTACLIYTSGTTGKPKGVVLTHRNLAANGVDWHATCGPLLPEAPRELLWLPLSHIFGWGAACIGTAVGFVSKLVSPWDVPAELQKYRPHVFMTVPILLERLASAAADGEQLRAFTGGELALCLAGGAALAPSVKRRYRDAGIPLLEGYGLSETAPTLTLERTDTQELDTVGAAYPSVTLRLAEDGEVLAKGPNVFKGYYRDEDATRAAIDADGWFHTGDLGQLTPSGNLKIIGRKKELLVLSNGKKVAPAPIEAAAAEDPWIERMILFGTGRPSPVALLVLDAEAIARDLGRPIEFAALADDPEVQIELEIRIYTLNNKLSRCERVRGFTVARRPLTVEEGHLTPSFKVRRKAVWDAFHEPLERLYQEVCA